MELNRENLKKLFGLVAFGVLLAWGLENLTFLGGAIRTLLGLLAPFLAGGCIAFILNVPMNFVERCLPQGRGPAPKGGRSKGGPVRRAGLGQKLRRPLSLVLTLLLVAAVLFIGSTLVVPEISNSLRSLGASFQAFPKTLAVWADDLAPYLPEMSQWVNSLQLNWKDLLGQAVAFLRDGAGSFLGSAWDFAAGFFSGLFTFFLGFIFACYILMQKEELRRKSRRLLYAYLPKSRADRALEVASLSYSTFASFLSGQCLEAVILGLMFFVTLSIFRFPYALMISVLIAFTALIPIFGAFIGCAVGAFMILMQDPMQAVWFVVFFLVLQQVEGNFIYPKVVGSSVGLPSIWVLVAVTIGGSTMGVVGMLVFIPLCSVLYTLLNRNVDRRLRDRKLDP